MTRKFLFGIAVVLGVVAFGPGAQVKADSVLPSATDTRGPGNLPLGCFRESGDFLMFSLVANNHCRLLPSVGHFKVTDFFRPDGIGDIEQKWRVD